MKDEDKGVVFQNGHGCRKNVHGVETLTQSTQSDNGSQFMRKKIEEFLFECRIECRRSPSLWPQAKGDVQ